MSLIWILLAVVYAKSNEVVDREERVPTLHNSTSEQNQSISYTAPSEINKYGVVKPAIKYFTSSVVCNENLTLQENVHRFDSNPLNSTDTSGRHFNHTTLPKLSKSNKSIYDFYFSYDLDVVQDLFNGISTSRLIPKNEKFMPNQQKYNSSMSSNGDGTVDERLKNRSFEILKTEVGVNKSQEIDEASNFFQNIQTVSTIPVRLRKDTDSLENTSKNKIFLRDGSHRSQPLSQIGIKTKRKIKPELIDQSPSFVPAEITSNYVSEKYSPAGTIKMNESDFVIGSDAFINPNMSQLSVDHPSKERLKIKSKREPKHPHSQKSIEKLYDDFDWYGDDDIYDLIGTTGKIEIGEDYLKEFESILPGFKANKNGERKVTKGFGVRYPTRAVYKNVFTTEKKNELGPNYYYEDKEKDNNQPILEEESVKKDWYLKKSKERISNEQHVTPNTVGLEQHSIYSVATFGKTTSGSIRALTEHSYKTKITWTQTTGRPSPVKDEPRNRIETTSAGFYLKSSPNIKQDDPSDLLWKDILFLPDYSYGTEQSEARNFILWKRVTSSKKSPSEGSSFASKKSTEGDDKSISRSPDSLVTKKLTTKAVTTELSRSPDHRKPDKYDLSDNSDSLHRTKDTDEYDNYNCNCATEAATTDDTSLTPEPESYDYSMYTDPRYTDDIYSQGSYDDVLNQFPNSEPKDPFSKSSYDPYDDYYTVSDKEYEDRIGSVTVDIERETGSFRKKKGSRCAGFRILPSCILLICISWLRYCTLALHTA